MEDKIIYKIKWRGYEHLIYAYNMADAAEKGREILEFLHCIPKHEDFYIDIATYEEITDVRFSLMGDAIDIDSPLFHWPIR